MYRNEFRTDVENGKCYYVSEVAIYGNVKPDTFTKFIINGEYVNCKIVFVTEKSPTIKELKENLQKLRTTINKGFKLFKENTKIVDFYTLESGWRCENCGKIISGNDTYYLGEVKFCEDCGDDMLDHSTTTDRYYDEFKEEYEKINAKE